MNVLMISEITRLSGSQKTYLIQSLPMQQSRALSECLNNKLDRSYQSLH